MLETPTPPEGYRLAEQGETYEPAASNGWRMAYVWYPWKATWLRYPFIRSGDYRTWFNSRQVFFAVPLEKQDV